MSHQPKGRIPHHQGSLMSENVAVFARGQSTRSLPLENLPREAAEDLVATGFARWVNHRRNSIQMTREPASFKARDESCQMGPRVIEAAAMGSQRHIALVEAWA